MLKAGTNGLSAAEVADRIERGEINRFRHSARAEYAEIVARNLFTLFNALVVPAAIALFILGEYRDAVAVSGMAITNAVLGLAQEIRAKRHLDRLALLAESTVRVLRDGSVVEIQSGDVVFGDLVVIVAGDAVVADGAVIEAHFLEVDEALLTGESDPVPRVAGERVLSGSFVVAGEGRYRADGVGGDSYVQRTAAEARRYRFNASPLQESVNRLIRILTVATVALCAVYVVLWSARDYSRTELVQMIAATVTSMVPQGLVLMVTLAFVLGAVRLAARGAVARRLDSVETMAVIDTLCTDKTGTLTTGDLRLREVHLLSEDVGMEEVRQRLALFASASSDRGNKSIAALRVALQETSVELVDQLAFKSQTRYSAVRVRSEGAEHVLVLGAPETLIPRLTPGSAATTDAARLELTKTGLRLMLFADSAENRPFGGSLDGFTLRPLALVTLGDQLRAEAAAALQALAEQGIDFKVLSGDHPETVRATIAPLATEARAMAFAQAPVSGSELENAPNPTELILGRSVFGRVSPWQKVQIVVALKEAGRRVAMLGDGVNDVLAIKNADLGIAQGGGSRAAKAVAGLVLTNDSFDLLPATLEEGRIILRNLRRAGKLFLVKNVFTVILIVGAVILLNLPFPFLPRQVTLLNALTIGGPALLLTLNRERAPATHSDFLREVGSFVIRTGAVVGIAVLALQWHAARVSGDDAIVQRTLMLTCLVLLGLVTLLRALTDGESARSPGDWKYCLLSAGSLVLYLGVVYWPPAAGFFQLVPLGIERWFRVLVAVIVATAVLTIWDRLRVGRRRVV